MRKPCSSERIRFKRVVLPLPRKPVKTVTGILGVILENPIASKRAKKHGLKTREFLLLKSSMNRQLNQGLSRKYDKIMRFQTSKKMFNSMLEL